MLTVTPSFLSNFFSSGFRILHRVLHASVISLEVVLCYEVLLACAHPECVENYLSDILGMIPQHVLVVFLFLIITQIQTMITSFKNLFLFYNMPIYLFMIFENFVYEHCYYITLLLPLQTFPLCLTPNSCSLFFINVLRMCT